jgi:hypothetical protein
MNSFWYNDMEFSVQPSGKAWDVLRHQAGGNPAVVGAALFPGTSAADADKLARGLVKSVYPVGVRVVGPDVAHPNKIGDLKIVGPDVTHPNFIYWDKDSASFPKSL